MVCQGLNVMLKSSIGGPLKCSINWPIQTWRLGGKAHDDGGQGGSWNEGFSWARPNCNILIVRIGLGKAYDHSLFVHSSCMFNVCMGYVCWSILCMYEICTWMNVCWHAMYVYDIYVVNC